MTNESGPLGGNKSDGLRHLGNEGSFRDLLSMYDTAHAQTMNMSFAGREISCWGSHLQFTRGTALTYSRQIELVPRQPVETGTVDPDAGYLPENTLLPPFLPRG